MLDRGWHSGVHIGPRFRENDGRRSDRLSVSSSVLGPLGSTPLTGYPPEKNMPPRRSPFRTRGPIDAFVRVRRNPFVQRPAAAAPARPLRRTISKKRSRALIRQQRANRLIAQGWRRSPFRNADGTYQLRPPYRRSPFVRRPDLIRRGAPTTQAPRSIVLPLFINETLRYAERKIEKSRSYNAPYRVRALVIKARDCVKEAIRCWGNAIWLSPVLQR